MRVLMVVTNGFRSNKSHFHSNVPYSHTLMAMTTVKCICQICTCGRHRCPQHPQTTVIRKDVSDPCTLTEYTNEFKAYDEPLRAESFRPLAVSTFTPRDGAELRTTTREDYVSHPVTPMRPSSPIKYTKPEGTMQKDSEYKLVYVPKKAVPQKPVRHMSATRNITKDKFDHKSSHAVDYVQLDPQKTESYAEKRSYQPPAQPFLGTSTVQTDFVDHGDIKPPRPIRPPENTVREDKTFQGTSSYSEGYVPQQLPKKFERPKIEYRGPDGEFSGETTFKSDFKSYDGTRPAQSLKPVRAPQTNTEPFEGTTVNRDSYKVWSMPPKHVRPPVVYTPPTEKFDTQTTVQTDFQHSKGVPAKSIRPAERPKDSNVPFDGSTTQKTDYNKWPGAERTKSWKPVQLYQPPTEKFEGQSTCASHYKGEFAYPAASSKPPEKVLSSNEPFLAKSSYLESYKPFDVQPRSPLERVEYHPPEGQFYGVTTFKSDFKSYDGTRPAQSLKPVRAPQTNTEPFEGTTVNRDSYKVWNMPPKHVRPPVVYTPPTEKFDTLTTVQTDFQHFKAVPAKSIRPAERPKDSNVPFDGSTTQKADYKEWPGAEKTKSWKPVQSYQPPMEKFEGQSMCQSHYKGEFAYPAKPVKPVNVTKVSNAKMDHTSLYKETFRGEFQPCPATYLTRENTPNPQFKYQYEDPGTGHIFFSPVPGEQCAMEVAA